MPMLRAQHISQKVTTTITVEPFVPTAAVTLKDKKTELPFYCSCQSAEPSKNQEFRLIYAETNFLSANRHVIQCQLCQIYYLVYECETLMKEVKPSQK